MIKVVIFMIMVLIIKIMVLIIMTTTIPVHLFQTSNLVLAIRMPKN